MIRCVTIMIFLLVLWLKWIKLASYMNIVIEAIYIALPFTVVISTGEQSYNLLYIVYTVYSYAIEANWIPELHSYSDKKILNLSTDLYALRWRFRDKRISVSVFTTYVIILQHFNMGHMGLRCYGIELPELWNDD